MPFPVSLKAGQVITIKDGVSYIGIIPLPRPPTWAALTKSSSDPVAEEALRRLLNCKPRHQALSELTEASRSAISDCMDPLVIFSATIPEREAASCRYSKLYPQL